jgi:predicted transcriptional regulator
MNAKRVSFSDINDVFTIPCVEGAKKLMTPWKKDLIVYSEEALEEQIQKRKEYAIREAKKKFMKLEKQYKELQQYIMSLDEDDDDDLLEYDMYVNMIEENFYEQSAVTSQLIALFIDK